MAYRQLFLFVEGDDDARFFQSVAVPFFRQRYENVEIVRYAKLKKDKLEGFVRSVQSIAGAEYLIVRDLDRHPCATAAKRTLLQRCSPAEPERIQIVKVEIESWYSAGIPEHDADWGELPIATASDTQEVTKESFHRALSASGKPLLPTLIALLERFDRKRAASRNDSFRYFLTRHLSGAL
jgi:hypothetical protein